MKTTIIGLCIVALEVLICETNSIILNASSTTPEPSKRQEHVCGFRLRGGFTPQETMEALYGEFPWVVAIYKYNDKLEDFKYLCVGSLIHHRVVLSVARHFKLPATLQVRAGDWDLKNTNELYATQTRDVDSVVIHPKFNNALYAYDVSLLFLRTDVVLAPNVGFTCLSPAGITPPAGSLCSLSGWQKTANNSSRNTLKVVDVSMKSAKDCETSIQQKVSEFKLHKSIMCAEGTAGRDVCLIEAGSPLVCPFANIPLRTGDAAAHHWSVALSYAVLDGYTTMDRSPEPYSQGAPQAGEDIKGRYYQAGVVSFGYNCGADGELDGYANIGYMRSWIEETLATKGYSTDNYSPTKNNKKLFYTRSTINILTLHII